MDIKIKTSKAGTGKLTLSNIVIADLDEGSYKESNLGSKSASFTVKSTTKKSTTSKTRTSTTVSTSSITTSSSSVTTIDPNFTSTARSTGVVGPNGTIATEAEARLTSVTVGNYDVKYDHGIYMVTVSPQDESVEVNATGPEGSTVSGIGTRALAVGTNLVQINLLMPNGQTYAFPLYIVRPDPNKQVDTRLKSLKVVGYDIKFNADVKEYTVTVPMNVKEVYIEYETYDNDVIVTGGGTFFLDSSNTAYIKSSYGTISVTDYTIKFKKSYLSVILIVIIVLLLGAIGGMLFYYFNEKKKASNDATNAKNKVAANANRAELAKGPHASFNGQSVVGTGRKTVLPTQVAPAPQPMQQPVMPSQPVNPAPAPAPTVASTQIASVSPPTGQQVKVIKRIVRQPGPAPMNNQTPQPGPQINPNGGPNPQ